MPTKRKIQILVDFTMTIFIAASDGVQSGWRKSA